MATILPMAGDSLNSRQWLVALLIVLASVGVSIVIPIAAPIIGCTLVVLGVSARKNLTFRWLAITAITTGMLLIITSLVIGMGFVATGSDSLSTEVNSILQ